MSLLPNIVGLFLCDVSKHALLRTEYLFKALFVQSFQYKLFVILTMNHIESFQQYVNIFHGFDIVYSCVCVCVCVK